MIDQTARLLVQVRAGTCSDIHDSAYIPCRFRVKLYSRVSQISRAAARSPRCPLTKREMTSPRKDVFISDAATLPGGGKLL